MFLARITMGKSMNSGHPETPECISCLWCTETSHEREGEGEGEGGERGREREPLSILNHCFQ
jgi:hypothetical protein